MSPRMRYKILDVDAAKYRVLNRDASRVIRAFRPLKAEIIDEKIMGSVKIRAQVNGERYSRKYCGSTLDLFFVFAGWQVVFRLEKFEYTPVIPSCVNMKSENAIVDRLAQMKWKIWMNGTFREIFHEMSRNWEHYGKYETHFQRLGIQPCTKNINKQKSFVFHSILHVILKNIFKYPPYFSEISRFHFSQKIAMLLADPEPPLESWHPVFRLMTRARHRRLAIGHVLNARARLPRARYQVHGAGVFIFSREDHHVSCTGCSASASVLSVSVSQRWVPA